MELLFQSVVDVAEGEFWQATIKENSLGFDHKREFLAHNIQVSFKKPSM